MQRKTENFSLEFFSFCWFNLEDANEWRKLFWLVHSIFFNSTDFREFPPSLVSYEVFLGKLKWMNIKTSTSFQTIIKGFGFSLQLFSRCFAERESQSLSWTRDGNEYWQLRVRSQNCTEEKEWDDVPAFQSALNRALLVSFSKHSIWTILDWRAVSRDRLKKLEKKKIFRSVRFLKCSCWRTHKRFEKWFPTREITLRHCCLLSLSRYYGEKITMKTCQLFYDELKQRLEQQHNIHNGSGSKTFLSPAFH